VLQKFGQRLKARFNPFLDSAGCTIAMRWQHRLKSNFSDQTLFLETLPRNRSHSLRASFAGRRTSLPSQAEELTPSGKKLFYCQRNDLANDSILRKKSTQSILIPIEFFVRAR
jgi:hypothetical protein